MRCAWCCNRAGERSWRWSNGIWASETEGDGPKELGKQPAGKKSRIRDAGRKKAHGAARQDCRGLSGSEAGGGQEPQGQFLGRRADDWSRGIPPTAGMKGNTLGVEKPLAAKRVLLVNWQQANTLITNFTGQSGKTLAAEQFAFLWRLNRACPRNAACAHPHPDPSTPRPGSSGARNKFFSVRMVRQWHSFPKAPCVYCNSCKQH